MNHMNVFSNITAVNSVITLQSQLYNYSCYKGSSGICTLGGEECFLPAADFRSVLVEESGGAVTLLLQLLCKSADAQSAVKAAAGNKAATSSQHLFVCPRLNHRGALMRLGRFSSLLCVRT